MSPKIRNIIIFVAIAAVLILGYIFFIKPSPDQGTLVSTPSEAALPNVNGVSGPAIPGNASGTFVAGDFLKLLLNVKTIKLDDAIFADPAFNSLHDSSIELTPDGTEGRPNPFAQFGNDISAAPSNTSSSAPVVPTTPTVPVVPATPTTPNKPTTPVTPKKPTTPATPTSPIIPVTPTSPIVPPPPAP